MTDWACRIRLLERVGYGQAGEHKVRPYKDMDYSQAIRP